MRKRDEYRRRKRPSNANNTPEQSERVQHIYLQRQDGIGSPSEIRNREQRARGTLSDLQYRYTIIQCEQSPAKRRKVSKGKASRWKTLSFGAGTDLMNLAEKRLQHDIKVEIKGLYNRLGKMEDLRLLWQFERLYCNEARVSRGRQAVSTTRNTTMDGFTGFCQTVDEYNDQQVESGSPTDVCKVGQTGVHRTILRAVEYYLLKPHSLAASALVVGIGPPGQEPEPMVVFSAQAEVSAAFEKLGVQALRQCARAPQKGIPGLQRTRLGTYGCGMFNVDVDYVDMFEITNQALHL
jgi:hypothetical protein